MAEKEPDLSMVKEVVDDFDRFEDFVNRYWKRLIQGAVGKCPGINQS